MLSLENKTGLSLANARMCVRLSAEVYSVAPTISNPHTDTQLTVTEFDNALVVAFRGTKDIANFVTDAKAWRVQRTFGAKSFAVHAGFCDAIESVVDELVDHIRAMPVIKPVIATGHSLGGALARLSGIYLRKAGFSVSALYTFGEPRSGDAALADLCNALFGEVHWRFEDEADCVTRIPGWLAGYRHSGQNVFLDAFGGYYMNPSLWMKAASDAWEIYKVRKAGPAAVACLLHDHQVARYEAKLSNLTP